MSEQETPPSQAERKRKRVQIALLCQVFIIMLGIGIVGPIMPLYAKSFGVSSAMVGGLITAFGVARILANMPVGRLGERFGRRPLLIIGPLITALAALLMGLASQFGQMIVLRFLQGLGSAAQTTTAMTVMADVSTPRTRGRAMSYYQGSLLIGQSVGPIVGGLVGEHYGFRVPFFLYAGLAAAAALWSLLVIPESRPEPVESARPEATAAKPADDGPPAPRTPGAMAALLLDPSFILISLVTLAIFFTRTGSRSTVLPLFGTGVLGLSPGQLGVSFTIIAVLNFVTLTLCGSLSDRFGRKAVIVPGCIVSGLALVFFALSRNHTAFLLSGVLLGIGTGLAGPAPAAYVADLARPGSYGTTMGLYRTFGDVGVSVGPVLLGWLSDTLGYGAALGLNAVLFIACGAAFGLFARETAGRHCPAEARIESVRA